MEKISLEVNGVKFPPVTFKPLGEFSINKERQMTLGRSDARYLCESVIDNNDVRDMDLSKGFDKWIKKVQINFESDICKSVVLKEDIQFPSRPRHFYALGPMKRRGRLEFSMHFLFLVTSREFSL